MQDNRLLLALGQQRSRQYVPGLGDLTLETAAFGVPVKVTATGKSEDAIVDGFGAFLRSTPVKVGIGALALWGLGKALGSKPKRKAKSKSKPRRRS